MHYPHNMRCADINLHKHIQRSGQEDLPLKNAEPKQKNRGTDGYDSKQKKSVPYHPLGHVGFYYRLQHFRSHGR